MRVGIAWECPWVPSSYGKLSLWLAVELQRLGFHVRVYCPSNPELTLYSKCTQHAPRCDHRELGVCVEPPEPIEVCNTRYLCSDSDVDVYVLCGSPYGQVESQWVSECSKTSHPVAGYFVTESDILPSLLAQWALHVDAVGFTTNAVANAFVIHEPVRELHGDYVVVPHGLPDYYFSLTADRVLDYASKLVTETPGMKLLLESLREGVVYGMVAKDHPRKDFAALLSAFAKLKHSCRDLPVCDKIRLFLGTIKAVGAPTWIIDTLRDQLGLSKDDVVVLDESQQVSGVTELGLLHSYSLISVFVFPTMGEGFGLPPLEAGALFRPVILTRTPVTEEVWGDYPLLVKSRPFLDPTGFILHATDYEDLARKMDKLLAERNRRRYGRLARRVAEKYTSSLMAKSFTRLVELAEEKRGTKKPHPLPEYKHAPTPEYRELVLRALGYTLYINPYRRRAMGGGASG